jgi:hypothetical protein
MAEVYCKRTSCRHNSQEHCNCSVIELDELRVVGVVTAAVGYVICEQYGRRLVDAGRIDDLVSGRAKWGEHD